jgi:hypothetical protein
MKNRALSNLRHYSVSRAWFVFDALFGILRGSRCPNCGWVGGTSTPVVGGALGLKAIRSCGGCGLLFRPMGITDERLLRGYYSYVYANADLATDMHAATDAPAVAERVRAEGKDRAALLARLAPGLAGGQIAVVGCSWGYEVISLRQAGFDAFGVEIGAPRREFGRKQLGIEIYPDVAAAGAARGGCDLVLSSHMIEHVARPSEYLDAMVRALRPKAMIHIAPHVESLVSDPTLRNIIGVEHPIGMTASFWTKYAGTRGFKATVCTEGYERGVACGEIVACLECR